MSSPKPHLLFAPGAGAPSTSSWMNSWSARLSLFSEVERFDYPYQLRGSKRPDPLPTLVTAHLERFTSLSKHREVLLAGKSMGSRIGLHVAAVAETPPLGAICFGYPLVAQGSGKLRDAALCECPCPVLLLQGTRDPLCPLLLLEEVLSRRTGRTELYVVGGGDHDLKCTKAALGERGLSQEESDEAIANVVRSFVDSLVIT